MINNFPGEQWKTVQLNNVDNHEYRLDISNFGRLRTFNKLSNGKIVGGSMVNGYRIIRIKLFRSRDENAQQQFIYLQQQIASLKKQLKMLTSAGEDEARLKETALLLDSIKDNFTRANKKDLKERTVHYHALVHRLVADHFLAKPTNNETVVAHLDHDKLNNRANNLKWMANTENYEHQKKSPQVIKNKLERKTNLKQLPSTTKLTVTRVMFIKKLLNQGKSVRQLAKTFKVTDTQIIRIKRGENWAGIKAAE
jgi:hypothetical protein